MRERKRKGERERKRLAPPCPRVLSRNTSQNTIRRRKRDRNMFCSQKVCKNISWQFPLLPSLAGQAHGPSPMRFVMKNVIKAEECFFFVFWFQTKWKLQPPAQLEGWCCTQRFHIQIFILKTHFFLSPGAIVRKGVSIQTCSPSDGNVHAATYIGINHLHKSQNSSWISISRKSFEFSTKRRVFPTFQFRTKKVCAAHRKLQKQKRSDICTGDFFQFLPAGAYALSNIYYYYVSMGLRLLHFSFVCSSLILRMKMELQTEHWWCHLRTRHNLQEM